jgi:hypothetical protein
MGNTYNTYVVPTGLIIIQGAGPAINILSLSGQREF